CFFPVLRLVVVRRAIGLPSNIPPTRPSLARKSSITWVLKSALIGRSLGIGVPGTLTDRSRRINVVAACLGSRRPASPRLQGGLAVPSLPPFRQRHALQVAGGSREGPTRLAEDRDVGAEGHRMGASAELVERRRGAPGEVEDGQAMGPSGVVDALLLGTHVRVEGLGGETHRHGEV